MSVALLTCGTACVCLRRQPLFTIAAVLTLALGIGANTAVFAVVEAVLLRPLPYPVADDLAIVRHRDERTGITKQFIAIGDYVDLAARQQSVEAIAAYGSGTATVTADGDPFLRRALSAGPGLLETLGAAVGRPSHRARRHTAGHGAGRRPRPRTLAIGVSVGCRQSSARRIRRRPGPTGKSSACAGGLPLSADATTEVIVPMTASRHRAGASGSPGGRSPSAA